MDWQQHAGPRTVQMAHGRTDGCRDGWIGARWMDGPTNVSTHRGMFGATEGQKGKKTHATDAATLRSGICDKSAVLPIFLAQSVPLRQRVRGFPCRTLQMKMETRQIRLVLLSKGRESFEVYFWMVRTSLVATSRSRRIRNSRFHLPTSSTTFPSNKKLFLLMAF
jgi:hypothetical protein